MTNFVFIFQWSINPWIRLWSVKTNFEEKLECKKCDEDHEWQCGLDCITKSETCDGNCPDDYLFCNEYSKCIEITTPCENKCLSTKQPRLKNKSKHRYFCIEYWTHFYPRYTDKQLLIYVGIGMCYFHSYLWPTPPLETSSLLKTHSEVTEVGLEKFAQIKKRSPLYYKNL